MLQLTAEPEAAPNAMPAAQDVTGRTGRTEALRLGLWVLLAAGAFHAAYAGAQLGFLGVLYAFALLQLTEAPTWRGAFYSGLVVGLLIAVVRLAFFLRIFSGGALALWLVYAFWIGLFVALARLCRNRFPGGWGLLPVSFLWCGLEYFRSELYYLRFAWLSPGFAFSSAVGAVPISKLGVYGLGFVLMAIACVGARGWQKSRLAGLAALVVGAAMLRLADPGGAGATPEQPTRSVRVAGVQMEFPSDAEVLLRLTELVRQHPEADLLVLSEYTFTDPVPGSITNWCRRHQRYLAVGGKDPALNGNFYDSAFVISPAGEIVFRQAKCVPIQFIRDGLPALDQRLWDSPWGKLGFCICYDLSYSRVTDRLIQQGAQALIVPTMDLIDWGLAQHQLHARIAPVRAAEYGVPVFRLASSGISQAVNSEGRVLVTAPCPGDAAVISSTLQLRGPGRLPWDRYLAPLSVGITGLLCLLLSIAQVAGALAAKAKSTPEAPPHQ